MAKIVVTIIVDQIFTELSKKKLLLHFYVNMTLLSHSVHLIRK